MSVDGASVDWLGHGGLLLPTFSAAVVCVALLRRPCRRWFGAECAFALWLLPPLAMLAGQLPHMARSATGVFSSAVLVVVSAVDTDAGAPGAAVLKWHAFVAWVWLAGTVASLALAAVAQARYGARLRGAAPLAGMVLPWPVLRAPDPGLGPALAGAWRPRIVVPGDFEARYDADERALILAHEAMHARRRDGWWRLLAQLCASLLWFHPLAWWAFRALRHDQELACDAAVLREHAGCRRSYARAMLKTPAAMQVLPIGCSWSSRHPLTERIAMLKQSSPSGRRRHAGMLAGMTLVPAHARAQAAIGRPVRVAGIMPDGQHTYVFEVTPLSGCPARAAHGYAMVSLHVEHGTVRAAAESVASQANLELVNPKALGNGPVGLDFREVPADRALRMVADLAGSRVVMDGTRARFAPRQAGASAVR